ncbi:hypothetical protein EAO77_20915 [Streptomyces sp. t39]|nr:hypothetical protein EAO77_20915 [Streptomyces sp. t39]
MDRCAGFDLWRLRWYGLSLPEPLDVTDQDLRTAVRSLEPLLTGSTWNSTRSSRWPRTSGRSSSA